VNLAGKTLAASVPSWRFCEAPGGDPWEDGRSPQRAPLTGQSHARSVRGARINPSATPVTNPLLRAIGLSHVINLDETESDPAVLASQDGAEGARRQ